MYDQSTLAESLAEDIREYYSAPSTKNNQIAAMLTVQNTLLNESLQMLKDLVTNTNQAIARERAQVLIKAITDNNYPMGAVLDIRPTITALKDLNYS